MKSDFYERICIKPNLKRQKNISNMQKKISKNMNVFITSEEISKSVQIMAEKIAIDYQGKPLAIVCVDYGGREFYNLLIDNLHSLGVTNFFQGAVKVERAITAQTTTDREKPKFHYESGIICDLKKLKQVHLLIVDDQMGTGKTYDFLKERYSVAQSVELAALIVRDLARNRLNDIKYYSFYKKIRIQSNCWFWYGL